MFGSPPSWESVRRLLPVVFPHETDAELVVDPNRVPASPVTCWILQAVPGGTQRSLTLPGAPRLEVEVRVIVGYDRAT